MSLPTMTDEQRKIALERATAARKARSELIEQVRGGKVSVADLLRRADKDDLVKKTRIAAVVKALPGVGPATAAKIMDEAEIPADRRIGGLGSRQRAALLEALEH